MANEHAKNLMGVQREATMKGDSWAANIAVNAAAEITRLATELAEAKKHSGHHPTIDRVRKTHTRMTVENFTSRGQFEGHREYMQGDEACYLCTLLNEIAMRDAELAAARAKVDRGERFKEWVINNLDPYEGWRGLVSMSRRVAAWEADDAAQHPVKS